MVTLKDMQEKVILGTFQVNELLEFYNENPKSIEVNLLDYLDLLNILEEANQISDIITFYNTIKYRACLLRLLVKLVYIKDDEEDKILNRIGKQIYYSPFERVNIALKYLKAKGFNILDQESFGDAYYISISVREEENFLVDVDFSLLNGYNISEFILRNPEYTIPKLKEFLSVKTNTIRIGSYNNENKKIFAGYFDQVYYMGISFTEWLLLEQILVKEFGITEIDFGLKEFILLYRYFMTHSKDIISNEAYEYICQRTAPCFRLDFAKDQIPEYIDYNIKEPSYMQILYDESINKEKKLKYEISLQYAYDHYEEIKASSYKTCVYINFGSEEKNELMSFVDFEKAHAFYEGVRDYVERFNFTPLEKYIFTYLLTTIFKKYRLYKDSLKEDNEHVEMARNKYYILFHDYIVCEGYTNFLTTIHSLVGLNSVKLFVCPPEVRDNHSRIITYLVDPKYNVDGIYIGDPTFDSPDYSLNHAFMTKDKKDYDKHQGKDENARIKFHHSMALLGFNYPEFDATKESSFDILTREISPSVIKEALTNMFIKMHPFKTNEEIERDVMGIMDESSIPCIAPNYNFDTKLSECDFSFKKYMLLIKNYNLNAHMYESGCDAFGCTYGFTISLPEIPPLELLDILNKSNLKDNHMTFIYSKYMGYCSVKFVFSPDETVNEFQRIVNEDLQKISIFLGVYKEEPKKETSTSLILVNQVKK